MKEISRYGCNFTNFNKRKHKLIEIINISGYQDSID